jgi:ParB-like chromosome segregation protein Spo0J
MATPTRGKSPAFEVHPAAKLFPLLKGKDYHELKADIETRGLIESIVKKGEMILDGRNRLAVCQELGIEPRFIEYDGNDEIGFIVAKNVLRRHLTEDQRVMIVTKIRGEILSKEAEARIDRARHRMAVSKSTQPFGRTYEKIAEEAKTTRYKARAALIVTKHAPGLVDRVIAGKQRLAEARSKARELARKLTKPKKEKTLREHVEAKFVRFMESFAPSEFAEVRSILRELLAIAARGDLQLQNRKTHS